MSAVAAPRRPRAERARRAPGAHRRHLGAAHPRLRGGADRHRHASRWPCCGSTASAATSRTDRDTIVELQQRAARAARRPARAGRAWPRRRPSRASSCRRSRTSRRAPLAAERAPRGRRVGAAALRPPHPADADVRVPGDRRARRAHGAGAAARRRRAREGRRGPAARRRCRCGRRAARSSTAPARCSRSRTRPSPSACGRRACPTARASRRSSRSTRTRRRRRSSSGWAGARSYVYVARRLNPSVWTRITKDPVLGPLVKARVIEPQPEPRRVYPQGRPRRPRSSASTAPASRASSSSRNNVLSARDGLASVSKVNDRPNGDTHWARVLHVREPVPGKAVQLTLDTRIQSLVQKTIADDEGSGTPRPSPRSCSTRAPAASSRWPRRRAFRRGLPRRQRHGVAAARDHRPLRAGLDVQARDVHGRAAGGRDHARDDVPGALDLHQDVRRYAATRARSTTRTPRDRELVGDARSSRTPRTSARSRSPSRSSAQTALQKWIDKIDFGERHRRRPAGRGRRASRCDNDKWYGTAILNVPIGESIAVTPLQMAALYGSIANGGTWIQPHVTAAIGGKPTTGWKHRQLVSKHVAAELRGMLTQVVDLGTGAVARIKGYSVAGKTGTTPKYDAKHGPPTAIRTSASASTRRRSSASRPPRTRASSRSSWSTSRTDKNGKTRRARGRQRRGPDVQAHRPGHPAGAAACRPTVRASSRPTQYPGRALDSSTRGARRALQ